jgi:hypothetical protein
MFSEAVMVALIAAAGTIVGAVATIIVARIQARSKAGQSGPPEQAASIPVLGEAIDIRELRILRALFGEPEGRFLEGYKEKYYRPSLEATIRKGWVKRIEGRYYMTTKGADLCRAYLRQLLEGWRPAAQILA